MRACLAAIVPIIIAAVSSTVSAAGAPVAPDVCLFPPGLEPVAFPDAAPAEARGGIHRIVLKFVIVRRSNGSGGLDETLLDGYMRDLNYGFRDTPFRFVMHPTIRYRNSDTLYNNIPDWPTATNLLAAYQQPGVMVHIVTPTIFGGPPVTGLNYVTNPRGNIVAYERIGQPHSIVFPPHEVGHVFFLYHPFETRFGTECTSGANCEDAGDFVCDTPASMSVHGNNTTATGIYYAVDDGPCEGDPIFAPNTRLYMEAGWPAGHILRDRFTEEQLTRMLDTLFNISSDLIGPQRPDFVVDCDENGVDDVVEILDGTAIDGNLDMVPDVCQLFPADGDLLVSGMTDDVLNRVRYFDGATGDFRDTMWNGMTWVHQLRMGPDGLVYIARLSIVQRLDLATGRTKDNFIDSVLLNGGTTTDLLFRGNGEILVLDNTRNLIRRHDGETGDYLGVFSNIGSVMTSPKYMEYGPDGDIFVVGNGAAGGGTIQRVRGTDGARLGSFIAPGAGGLTSGQGLVFHSDGRLYVSNSGANNVLCYDATSGAFVGEFVRSSANGGLSNPHSLRFGPDGHLYVASRNTHSVKRYDGTTGDYIDDFVTAGADGLDSPAGLLFVPIRCTSDIDGSGAVDFGDILAILAAWGNAGGAEDLDHSGTVDFGDLLTVLAEWGPC